jgi:hypothetical protein
MAELSLSKFRSNVTDVARPNRFWVSMNGIENDIASYGNDNTVENPTWNEKYEFLIKTSSIPGRTIGDIALNWQGMKYNIAGDPTFEDITFTFINNYEWDLRAYFEQWIESISHMATNERSQPGIYKTDVITMQQLGRTQGDILAEYKLMGAYPTTLSATELSMDSTDGTEEISVTIKYDYFEYVSGNQEGSPPAIAPGG